MRKQKQPAAEQLPLFGAKYLNIEQVAGLLGVPKSFIYRRTARGHGDPIPHYRIGSHLRFRADDIHAWIEQHRCEESAPIRVPLVAASRENRRASRARFERGSR